MKSGVVVGLLHNSLKIPHLGRMNFLLTVLTCISDPKLVLGFHSSHVVMCVLTYQRPMDWTIADKVLWKTQLDLHPKCLAVHFCGFALQKNGLASLQELDEVGKRQVDR